MNPDLLQQVAKPLGVLFALHRNLQVKIATRVCHKAAGNQSAANVGEPAAGPGDDMARHTGDEPSPAVENAQQNQSLIEVGLVGQGDEIVSHLM